MLNCPMKKELRMTYPPITSYHHHASLFSIILHDECAYDWIYNNYIQLETPRQGHEHILRLDHYMPFDNNISIWQRCPFVSVHKIYPEICYDKWTNRLEFVIESLSKDFYCYLWLDEYYLSSSEHFQKNHFIHDILIYGYDMAKQVLNVAEYFKGGKYSYGEVRFDEFLMACVDNPSLTWLIRFESWGYVFNIDITIRLLKEYLGSENTSLRFGLEIPKKDYIYGMAIYDVLLEYIEQMRKGEKSFDSRPFHVLWEHKTLMTGRIEYLHEKRYLDDKSYGTLIKGFTEVEAASLILRNLHIKFSITQQKDICEKMHAILLRLRDKETILIKELICDLEQSRKLIK